MILHLSDKIWIGDSDAGKNILETGMEAALNVAQDLYHKSGWPDIEYTHIGLVDGPGNPVCAYCAAILALHTLVERGYDCILVYCHDGGRSLAVVVMYLVLRRGKTSSHPTFLNYWVGWDKIIAELAATLDDPLPAIHEAHKRAFDKLPLAFLEQLT